jgi:hypothetical protein
MDSNPIEIDLNIIGKVFEDGWVLSDATKCLESFGKILDSSILTYTNNPRMSDELRGKYRIRITDIKQASLDAKVLFDLAGQLALISSLSSASPKDIFELAKSTWDYLSIVTSAKKDDKLIPEFCT